MSDRLALANAIADAGIERSKAERMASVIIELVRGSAATKGDVLASEAALRTEIAATRTDLKADIGAQISGVRALLGSETARLDCELACNNDPLRGVFRVQSRPL